MADRSVTVVGAGLAGSEAALRLSRAGVAVDLYEMRPAKLTPAHRSGRFAELVCSNSLGSAEVTSGKGLLKEELPILGAPLRPGEPRAHDRHGAVSHRRPSPRSLPTPPGGTPRRRIPCRAPGEPR